MASQINSGKTVNASGNFDLELLVQDVQAIVSSTLKDKLKGLYEMNREYKQTHDAVMQIPAVRKLVQPSNLRDVTTDTSCEEIQRILAENASLKAKVSELENSILKMMDSQDAHFTSLDPELENITLVIEETEEVAEHEIVESEDDDEIEIAAAATAIAIEEEEEEEEEDDSAENEEIATIHDVSEEEETGEDDDQKEEEQEIIPGAVTVHRETEETESNQDVDDEEDEEEEEGEEEEEEEADAEEVEMNEEVEVIEVEIKGKPYFTTDETSGVIYACTPDGDIGDEVGKFVGGKPVFTRK